MRVSTITAITFANAAAAAPASLNMMSWYWSELAAIASKYHTTPSGWPTFPTTTSSGSTPTSASLLMPAIVGVSHTSTPARITSSTSTSTSLLLPAISGTSTATTSSVIIPTTSSTRSVVIPTTLSSSIVIPTTSSTTTPVIIQTTSASVQTPLTTSTTSTSSFVSPVTAQATTALPLPTDYASAAIYNHNIHRQNHSAPGLTYNNVLAGYAATVAASCNFAHDLSEGGGGYGQNIAAYGSSDLTGFTDTLMLEVAISDQWYDGEISYFLPEYYGEPTPDMSNFEAWGHFSQVVWYSSTGVGCATQLCAPNTIFDGLEGYFTVCNYEGAGNIGGLYGVNVLEPLGEPTYNP